MDYVIDQPDHVIRFLPYRHFSLCSPISNPVKKDYVRKDIVKYAVNGIVSDVAFTL